MASHFEEYKINDKTNAQNHKQDTNENSKELMIITIELLGKTYDVKLKENLDPLLQQIIANIDFFESEMKKRLSKEKNKKIAKVSNYHVLTALEFFLKHNDIKHSSMEDEKCSICLCEFFDDINALSLIDICNDLQLTKTESEIIRLEHCEGHYFHLECILNYMNSSSDSHIKCPNCTKIYGVMTGTILICFLFLAIRRPTSRNYECLC